MVNFVVPVICRVKINWIKNRDWYLDDAREVRKSWNWLVTVIPVVIGARGTVSKWLKSALEDSEIGGRIKPIKNHR